MHPRTLTLTAVQRAELEQIRARARPAYLRERAAALLKVAAGQSPRQVALGGVHRPRQPKTVRRWLTAYEQRGLASLVQRPRGHRGFSPSAGRATARDGALGTRVARDRPRAGG